MSGCCSYSIITGVASNFCTNSRAVVMWKRFTCINCKLLCMCILISLTSCIFLIFVGFTVAISTSLFARAIACDGQVADKDPFGSGSPFRRLEVTPDGHYRNCSYLQCFQLRMATQWFLNIVYIICCKKIITSVANVFRPANEYCR